MLKLDIRSIGTNFTKENISEILNIWRSDQIVLANYREFSFAGLGTAFIPYEKDEETFINEAFAYSAVQNWERYPIKKNQYGWELDCDFAYIFRTPTSIPESPVTNQDFISLSPMNQTSNFCRIYGRTDLSGKYLHQFGLFDKIITNIKNTFLAMPERPYLCLFSENPKFYDLSEKQLMGGKIKTIHWFNIFGKPLVDKFGLSFFMDAPAWKKEVLEDGSVQMLLSEFYWDRQGGPTVQALSNYFYPIGVRYISWDNQYYLKKKGDILYA